MFGCQSKNIKIANVNPFIAHSKSESYKILEYSMATILVIQSENDHPIILISQQHLVRQFFI